MTYSNARYANAEKSIVIVERGSNVLSVPVSHRVFHGLIADAVPIAEFSPPGPTADDVRREASRRMQALVGARDVEHLSVILSNAQREAIRLLRIGADNWTAEQAVRAAELEAADAEIEAIRAASNAMEASPPTDYVNDQHWP